MARSAKKVPNMDNVVYLRSQAALCFEIARALSDPKAAERERGAGAEYNRRADLLEIELPTKVIPRLDTDVIKSAISAVIH